MRLNKPKYKKPCTPYKHEGYKTASYYASDLVRCDHKVWTNDSTIQFGIHFMMSSYTNGYAMMITPCSLERLRDKRSDLSKEAYQETFKSTAKKCIKPFDPDDINFVIAPFSLGIHWTGIVATCHKDDSMFTKGPM